MMRSNLSEELDFGHCLSYARCDITLRYDAASIMMSLLLRSYFSRRYSDNDSFSLYY